MTATALDQKKLQELEEKFDPEMRFRPLAPVAGTLVGALYGSALLTVLTSVVGSFTAHRAIVIGALFVVSVIFFPKGLVGYLAPALRRWRSKRA